MLIKPIFGCEAYFITDDCIEKGTRQHRYHLILLAKNETGYVNLMKMMSEAASGDMFYYYPRTTLDMLRRYHEGIICTSACVSGIIPRMYFDGRPDEARRWALAYQEASSRACTSTAARTRRAAGRSPTRRSSGTTSTSRSRTTASRTPTGAASPTARSPSRS